MVTDSSAEFQHDEALLTDSDKKNACIEAFSDAKKMVIDMKNFTPDTAAISGYFYLSRYSDDRYFQSLTVRNAIEDDSYEGNDEIYQQELQEAMDDNERKGVIDAALVAAKSRNEFGGMKKLLKEEAEHWKTFQKDQPTDELERLRKYPDYNPNLPMNLLKMSEAVQDIGIGSLLISPKPAFLDQKYIKRVREQEAERKKTENKDPQKPPGKL